MSALRDIAVALASGMNHEQCKRSLLELATAAELKLQEACGFAWDLGADLARVTAERDAAMKQGRADTWALHDALGWAREFGETLPPPWRGVTEIIRQRDEARADLASFKRSFVGHVYVADEKYAVVTEWARMAGWNPDDPLSRPSSKSALAALRERCAVIAEEYDGLGVSGHGYYDQGGDSSLTRHGIAAAIRAVETVSPTAETPAPSSPQRK